jgi:hypothetical protein
LPGTIDLDRAIIGYAVKITALGDHLAGRVDHHYLVALVGDDPKIVVAVDRDPIGGVEAGCQDRRGTRQTILDEAIQSTARKRPLRRTRGNEH